MNSRVQSRAREDRRVAARHQHMAELRGQWRLSWDVEPLIGSSHTSSPVVILLLSSKREIINTAAVGG